jgi:hypothetical protein
MEVCAFAPPLCLGAMRVRHEAADAEADRVEAHRAFLERKHSDIGLNVHAAGDGPDSVSERCLKATRLGDLEEDSFTWNTHSVEGTLNPTPGQIILNTNHDTIPHFIDIAKKKLRKSHLLVDITAPLHELRYGKLSLNNPYLATRKAVVIHLNRLFR